VSELRRVCLNAAGETSTFWHKNVNERSSLAPTLMTVRRFNGERTSSGSF